MAGQHWSTQRAALLVESANSIITAARLEELGVAPSTTYRRCRVSGPWQRVLPGVVALHDGPLTARQRLTAGRLYSGADSVVTGAAACRLHALDNVPRSDKIHLLVPADRRRRNAGFALVERTHRMPTPLLVDDFPVAPAVRACLDLSRQLNSVDQCRALLTELVQRRFATVAQLRAELDVGSDRGAALPRRVLAELDDNAHSVAELRAQRLWKRSGLPTAVWNGTLYTRAGEYIANPDAWSREAAFAWEIDSTAHHSGQVGFAKTVARNSRYTAAGVTVLQTLPTDLQDKPAAVIQQLQSTYAAALDRPKPPVIFEELCNERHLRAS